MTANRSKKIRQAPPTEAQMSASRENGKQGGRPRTDLGTTSEKRNRDLARRLLMDEQVETARWLIHTRDNPRLPMDLRMRAAENILDRGGTAKVAVQAFTTEDQVPVKLVRLKFGAALPDEAGSEVGPEGTSASEGTPSENGGQVH